MRLFYSSDELTVVDSQCDQEAASQINENKNLAPYQIYKRAPETRKTEKVEKPAHQNNRAERKCEDEKNIKPQPAKLPNKHPFCPPS